MTQKSKRSWLGPSASKVKSIAKHTQTAKRLKGEFDSWHFSKNEQLVPLCLRFGC